MKFYDSIHSRLVFIEKQASAIFWDDLWAKNINGIVYKHHPPKMNIFLRVTRRYLKPGSMVLEGGCGLAQHSWNLYLSGFDTLAIDYAPKTIEFLKKKFLLLIQYLEMLEVYRSIMAVLMVTGPLE